MLIAQIGTVNPFSSIKQARFMSKFFKILSAVVLLSGFGVAQAVPISCPGTAAMTDREMTVDPALDCDYVDANPQAADLTAAFGGSWSTLSEIAEAEGTVGSSSDSPLTISLAAGDSWGNDPDKLMAGTWELAANFWDAFGSAVLSFHFGGGQGSPDGWMFLLEPGEYFGEWSYDGTCCNGGGLSNVKLWITERRQVPEPGTLFLLGAGILGLGLLRRRSI